MVSEDPNPDNDAVALSNAQAVWKQTLQGIATTFGRLVHVSGLRDERTGRYVHYGLSQRYSEECADRVLTLSHEEAFHDWLDLSLQRQHRELDLYLAEGEGDPAPAVAYWLRLEPYRGLIPESIRREERELYIADIEILLDLMRRDLSSSS